MGFREENLSSQHLARAPTAIPPAAPSPISFLHLCSWSLGLLGLGFRVQGYKGLYRDIIRILLGALYRDNGKENGKY